MDPVQSNLASTVLKVAEEIEGKLDEELKELDDIDKLRERRLKELKERAQLEKEWTALGHGQYDELSDEKEFFNATKKSKNVVCHFFKSEMFLCKVIDYHMRVLCKRHLEAKFCKIDAARCKFLIERLNMKSFPTILCVVESQVRSRVVNFQEMRQCEDHCTNTLEWHIAKSGVLLYSGDLNTPPETSHSKKKLKAVHGIRGGSDDDSEDSDY
ncbi:uncharacterized protein LOC126248971 [Schistocerca nitens]|uniref:uncharacterized protein LOC126248971 n=1 Tax=Schistocerca nitens TaxID=7011 RepID=UPI002118CAEC|nr:uncharacterized protein LOC126248971 [Schistocerca nitens]XP_049806481.1 uncharacterized protein LOC126248971 [Schistocerca nitens]